MSVVQGTVPKHTQDVALLADRPGFWAEQPVRSHRAASGGRAGGRAMWRPALLPRNIYKIRLFKHTVSYLVIDYGQSASAFVDPQNQSGKVPPV